MNLRELAAVIRTKNAGPFFISADLLFDDEDNYRRVKESGVITRERVAALYSVTPAEVPEVIYFDPGRLIKINIRRPVPSGDLGDTDVLAMQQHAPLLLIDVP
jgi:hypothetical protein